MKAGCFYNPRPAPGRCIVDTQSNNIDGKCLKTENGCKLNISEKEKEIQKQQQKEIQIPATPFLSSIEEIENKIEKEEEKLPITGKISGPISAFSANFEFGKRIQKLNFFGDAHFSKTGICKPCQDFSLDAKTINNSTIENCYDISVLLSKVFTKAAQKNEWLDFYIELPFLNKGCKLSKADLENHTDYISKLHYIFYNCLHKSGCEYSTSRFHYVDSRLEYKKVDLECVVQDFKDFQGFPKFNTEIISLEMHVTVKMFEESMYNLTNMIFEESVYRNTQVENTDKLLKKLFFTGGNTLNGKVEPLNFRLFKLYLHSDDLINDVNKLLDLKSLNLDKNLYEKIYDLAITPNMIVKKNGKIMHKIRAQLYALEQEGSTEIAKYISSYFENKYLDRINVDEIMDIWNGVMIVYKAILNKKLSTPNFQIFKKKFASTMNILKNSIEATSVLMDIYLLARFFRNFSVESKESKKLHIPSTKTIVYAGNAHILTYVEFFETLSTKFQKYGQLNSNLDASAINRCVNVNLDLFL